MTDLTARIELGVLWREITWLIILYIRPLSKREKLIMGKKSYTQVAWKWIGKINGITTSSALTAENMSTLEHCPNIYGK